MGGKQGGDDSTRVAGSVRAVKIMEPAAAPLQTPATAAGVAPSPLTPGLLRPGGENWASDLKNKFIPVAMFWKMEKL